MTEAVKTIKDKSTLAKLLAGEDLHVVYNKVETASFDVKSRTLTLPVLKDVSEDVMDLLTLHEVGHALYTPLEMLEEVKNTKIPFGIVNIIEDVRIEKMIQDKYLGAVRNFKKGYAELLSKDFFKLSGRDLNSYSLIDRINLKAKHVPDVPMSEEDMVWYQKAQECKSYEDVLTLAESIHAYMEDQKPETDNHVSPEFDDSDSDNDEKLDNTEKSTIPDNSDGESVEEENNEEQEGSGGNDEEMSEENSPVEPKQDEVIEEGSYAETDSQLGKSISQSADENAKEVTYVNIPKVKDSIVRTGKQIVEDLKEHYERQTKIDGTSGNTKQYLEFCKKDFAEFRNSNKKTVAYMVKEFEMKKAADQYARASVAKTGALNMDVVHQYKFNDDLFNRVTSMPDAKNHGLVMYLDWSGSMCDNIHATVKQLVTLTMFCDAVQIPYRVYAFTDGFMAKEYDDRTYVQDPKLNDISIEILDLLEFASSENSKKDQQELFELLWTMTIYYENYNTSHYDQREKMNCYPVAHPSVYRLSGTPLNHAIIAGMTIIPKFKKQYGLQKVQLVLLTDGASHDASEFYADYETLTSGETHWKKGWMRSDYGMSRKQTTIKDPDSGYQVSFETLNYFQKTTMLLSLLKKKVAGLNVSNFHLVNTNKKGKVRRGEVERQVNYIYRNDVHYSDAMKRVDDLMKEIKKNNSASLKGKELDAIDAYFILPGGVGLDPNKEDEMDKVETGATKAQLRKAFVKSTTGKKINRPVLNEFMSLVA